MNLPKNYHVIVIISCYIIRGFKKVHSILARQITCALIIAVSLFFLNFNRLMNGPTLVNAACVSRRWQRIVLGHTVLRERYEDELRKRINRKIINICFYMMCGWMIVHRIQFDIMSSIYTMFLTYIWWRGGVEEWNFRIAVLTMMLTSSLRMLLVCVAITLFFIHLVRNIC